MKKLWTVAMLAAALVTVAACGKTIDGSGPAATPTATSAPSVDSDQIAGVVSEVQAGVKDLCGWVVASQSIVNIVSAVGVPYVGMVAEITKEACTALQATHVLGRRARSKPPSVTVKGKVIVLKAHRA
jgi:predicted small lipoprotein YifL